MICRALARPAAALAVFLTLASSAVAQPATKEGDAKAPSFPIEAEAMAFVGRVDRTELAKDEVFTRVLVELARSKLSPEAKADAFALMQERIGWLFVGAARMFPKCSYAQTVAMILSTYFKYQDGMPADLDVAALLELSRTARDRHPLRASNALLLATILNHKAARDSVHRAIDAKAIAKSQVPAIDLHNLSMAAALARDFDTVRKLVDLLPGIESEESREDVISVTGIYHDEAVRDKLEQFLRTRFPASFDNSVQTALIVLVHVSEQEHFRTFYKSLGELARDRKDIDRLRKFWDDGFRDGLQANNPGETAPLKIWDGFTVTLQKSGATITDENGYRNWISFE
jgi:hypothetical protein